MGKPKAARSFLEQLVDYEYPAPKDFDPEGDPEKNEADDSSSADEGGIDTKDGREHYVDIDKSKLRRSDGAELGPQYSGASVRRDVFEQGKPDHQHTKPFGSSGVEDELDGEQSEDEEEETLEAFDSDSKDHADEGDEEEDRVIPQISPKSPSTSTDEEKLEQNDNEEDEDEDDDDENSSSPQDRTDRVAVRKMMAEEQKSVAASLSAAAKADVAKGKAIEKQHSIFDSLLNTRIKLQKALIATNSMAIASKPSSSDSSEAALECASASRAAEAAALNLWKSLKSLRDSIESSPATRKRPLSSTAGSSNELLWNQAVHLEDSAVAIRRSTLTKWSQRTNPSAGLRPQNQFLQAPAQAPLTSVLDRHLAEESMERAIKRTRMARSCAPIQAAFKNPIEDENIYDDADFYTLLLRELVDRRMAQTQTTSTLPAPNVASILPSRTELKVKKQVDTKASKGRKMRYTVHEKLQNFMVADDKGRWGERQRAELFGSLLGRKVDMGEVDGNDDMDDDDVATEVNSLKLFGR